MPLSAHLPEPEPINMTPMIDVVFNLLIFFLLSATYLSEERELELSVPSVKSAAPAVSAPSDIVVNVHDDGRLSVSEKDYDAAGLETLLVKARENFPGQGVAIRGDENAKYQWIADVLAICKQAGIRRIDVVVQEKH